MPDVMHAIRATWFNAVECLCAHIIYIMISDMMSIHRTPSIAMFLSLSQGAITSEDTAEPTGLRSCQQVCTAACKRLKRLLHGGNRIIQYREPTRMLCMPTTWVQAQHALQAHNLGAAWHMPFSERMPRRLHSYTGTPPRLTPARMSCCLGRRHSPGAGPRYSWVKLPCKPAHAPRPPGQSAAFQRMRPAADRCRAALRNGQRTNLLSPPRKHEGPPHMHGRRRVASSQSRRLRQAVSKHAQPTGAGSPCQSSQMLWSCYTSMQMPPWHGRQAPEAQSLRQAVCMHAQLPFTFDLSAHRWARGRAGATWPAAPLRAAVRPG